MRETDLYPPVKAFLEAQGYAVKSEVEGCDVVAIRGEEPPVIVELKAVFSLALVFQGIARQSVADNVYLAVPPLPAPHRPPDGCAGALPPPRARAPDGPARSVAVRGGVAGPCRVPAAQAPAWVRETAARVPAPGRRSQRGRLQPAQAHDRVSAGCAALRFVPWSQRPDESRDRGQRGRRRQSRCHDARRPLWLVRASRRHAPRGLRPDAERPDGARGIRRCRGGAVTKRGWQGIDDD